MRILMLSSDPLILEQDSSARKRIEKYGELVERLVVLVISKEKFKIQDLRFKDKILIIPVFGGFFRFIQAFFIAREILKQEKIDLITCQDIEHCLIAFLLGKPFEAQIHTDIGSPYFWKHSFKNKLRYLFAKFLLKKASCVRIVSKRIQEFLIEEWRIPFFKIALIPILPTIRYPRVSFFSRKNFDFKKTILMVSRLAKEKNIALAIKAFAEVLKTNPDAGLVIVGDGPEKENLKSQISNLKINERVKFAGYQKNLVPYYLGADAFLLTSRYEGFGMSLVEAIYFGLPIVMSDVGIAGEIVRGDESALVVQPDDLSGFIKSLDRILNEEELRKRIVGSARKNLEYFLAGHWDYYREVIVNWQKCGE